MTLIKKSSKDRCTEKTYPTDSEKYKHILIQTSLIAVHEIFQQLVQKLYSSNLHFHLSETPFSAQILIRKKFLVDKSGVSSSALNCRNEEISDLKCKIVELEKQVESSSDTNKILEKKLGQAEIQALKAYEEQKTRIDALKNNIKKNDLETINLTKSLETEQKGVKENNTET